MFLNKYMAYGVYMILGVGGNGSWVLNMPAV